MEIIVLIPSYEPTIDFIDIIKELKNSFYHIVVVDDGSGDKYRAIFEQLETMQIPVLRHMVNQGKGRALKTGFHYIIEHFGLDCGIVTADSDGQHIVQDIKKVAKQVTYNPQDLILGTRNFDKENVPFKSSFGNKMTRAVLSFFCGVKVSDTQTGLRGLSASTASKMLSISGERFEYETNMLIETKKMQIHITEEEIQTIYLKENKGTHFNPIKDSWQIYKIFAKYVVISLSSFVVDITLFTMFLSAISSYITTDKILIATILARIISSLYNYYMNCKTVFHGQNSISTVFKYYLLAVLQMFISGLSVQFLEVACPTFINVVMLKLFVDTILFALNFYIQREWIFKEKKISL